MRALDCVRKMFLSILIRGGPGGGGGQISSKRYVFNSLVSFYISLGEDCKCVDIIRFLAGGREPEEEDTLVEGIEQEVQPPSRTSKDQVQITKSLTGQGL